MRNKLKPVALLLACCLGAIPAIAQSGKGTAKKHVTKEETVIIKKGPASGNTVIEIKDGTVYVNGEAVVTIHDADAASVHKKVIIENGDRDDGTARHFFGFPDDDERTMPRGTRKAMLGVLTDPESDKPGALVKEVTPGSAAEKAGLKGGDIITRVDGKNIKDSRMLVMEITDEHEPGDKVTIHYDRNGKEYTTEAKLMPAYPQTATRSFRFPPGDMNGDMPNIPFRGFPFLAGDDMTATPKLGVSVEDRADGEGVRVLSTKPGSPAAAAGIREGDVLTRLENDKVSSVDELQMALRSLKAGDRIKLEYQRAGKTATTNITLPKTVKRKDL